MRLLGAILAGGRSRRFGSDKAAALLDGRPLIDHVSEALAPQVAELVVVGREGGLADEPGPDLGPLGGLCAALGFATRNGFDAVLTAGCDVLPVPSDLEARLAPGPAVIDGQPLLGLWPASLHHRLRERLEGGGERSMRGWVAWSGARLCPSPFLLYNLNTSADLATYRTKAGQAT